MTMTDEEKWQSLQKIAADMAKKDLLDALLRATGLDEYIAARIADHEQQSHVDV
jgi:hypothetical protein